MTDRDDPAVERRMILGLGLAGLLSGLVLVSVYVATLPVIEANRAAALRRAVFEVIPGAERMQRLGVRGGALVPAGDGTPGSGIYGAYDGKGAFLGYAIAAEGPGFQDTIRLLYGFDPRRRLIVGMAVLESRETPGLGDRIIKDPAFVANFRELATSPAVRLVKYGTRSAPNEVDAISGATISSRAVVRIIDAGNAEWLARLPEPGSEPPLGGDPPRRER